MRSKRPFHSLIVCVSCAMVGCILTSTAYSRRVNAWPENVMKPLTNSKPR